MDKKSRKEIMKDLPSHHSSSPVGALPNTRRYTRPLAASATAVVFQSTPAKGVPEDHPKFSTETVRDSASESATSDPWGIVTLISLESIAFPGVLVMLSELC